MSDSKFSSDLFEQLGGVNWVTRPDWFSEAVLENSVDNKAETIEVVKDAVTNVDSHLERISSLSQNENAEISLTVHADTSAVAMNDKSVTSHVLIENAVVLIGPGLESVWQDETSVAWQLWQNIMLAFDWDESQVVFFDTELLVSDDMVFSTMEEVIDLGVEWVLTMDDEHEIVEQLSEGVQVVSVPDFESMLSDPYSKQSFYHTVLALSTSF